MIKKIFVSLFTFLAGFIFINAVYKTSGGHPSSTGAPGEQTCNRAGCHSDASTTKDSPVNTFTFSNPANTYNVNGSYNLSVQVDFVGCEKFGFEIVAVDSATQQNAGTWFITEPLRTQKISGEDPFLNRNYITHTFSGTVPISSGMNKWNFRWQAPTQNKGTIIFYYATNVTNKNDASTGDQLFLNSYKIRYSANSISVKNPEIIKPCLKINGNSIIISAEQQNIQSLKIYNLEGKLVYENSSLKNGDSISKEELNIFGNSVLVYQLETDKGSFRGKVRM